MKKEKIKILLNKNIKPKKVYYLFEVKFEDYPLKFRFGVN